MENKVHYPQKPLCGTSAWKLCMEYEGSRVDSYIILEHLNYFYVRVPGNFEPKSYPDGLISSGIYPSLKVQLAKEFCS